MASANLDDWIQAWMATPIGSPPESEWPTYSNIDDRSYQDVEVDDSSQDSSTWSSTSSDIDEYYELTWQPDLKSDKSSDGLNGIDEINKLPKASSSNTVYQEDFHSSITASLRSYLIEQIFESVKPIKPVSEQLALKIHQCSQRIENVAFNRAANADQYYQLIAAKSLELQQFIESFDFKHRLLN